jgi:hypothetical protein
MIEMIVLIYKKKLVQRFKKMRFAVHERRRHAKKGNKHEDEKSAFYSNNTEQKPLHQFRAL